MGNHYTVKKIPVLIGTLFIFGSAAGQRTYTNAVGMKFLQIPGNVTFSMGKATADPNGVFWDCAPVHQVKISHAYYMGVAEVTNAQYELFQPLHVRGTNRAVSGDTQPAVNVSWTQAEAFVRWLNQNYPPTQPGMSYRLPTEAEWEYAADNAGNYSLDMMQSGAEEWTGDWYGPYKDNGFKAYSLRNNFDETGILEEYAEVNSFNYYKKKAEAAVNGRRPGADEEKLAREGYGHLRAAIEVMVEQDILAKTIVRHGSGVAFPGLVRIQGEKLDEYKGSLNDIYEKCCKSIDGHSSSPVVHTTPTINELKADLELFLSIRKHFI